MAMKTEDKPRRRNAETTRAAILAAAQQAFAEIGYPAAGIRHIAALAGVDSALVQRYFGSKAGLFEAALSAAIPIFEPADLRQADFGPRLMAEFLTGGFGLRAQALITLSTGDAEARAISAKVLKARVIGPLSAVMEPPDAEARAMRLVMLSTAFLLYTRQVPVMTPEDAVANGTSDWLSGLLGEIIAAQASPAP
jgi:AcrR family transcriptional regulator